MKIVEQLSLIAIFALARIRWDHGQGVRLISAIRFLLIALSLFACALPLYGQDDTYTNKVLSVSVKKATDWKFITDEERESGLVDLNEPGLKEYVEAHKTRPFLTITKPRDIPQQPAITALAAPLDSNMSTDPVKDLQRMTASGASAFANYRIVTEPHAAKIGGRDGAYCKATYTAGIGGAQGDSVSLQTWVVVRGGLYFLIGAVSREPEDESTQKEIQQIIASFKIDDASSLAKGSPNEAPSPSESGDRTLMHMFQKGSALIMVVVLDLPSGPEGHVIWETSSPRKTRDFDVTPDEFEAMWSTLASSKDKVSSSDHFDPVHYYAFSTGYMPNGQKKNLIIPVNQASAPVVALAQKLRAYAADKP